MIKLSKEQQAAYSNYIKHRDKVKLVINSKNIKERAIRHSSILETVDVGLNHPMYVQNDEWLDYLVASSDWWKIEPEFREKERLRATRGDYGVEDDWDEPTENIPDLCELVKTTGFGDTYNDE